MNIRPNYRNFYRFAGRMRTPGSIMPSVYVLDDLLALLRRGKIVGTADLPLANDSDGNRDSMAADGDVRATNLVDTDLTNWVAGGNTNVTDNGDGSIRLQWPSGSGTYLNHLVSFSASQYTVSYDIKLTPGQTSADVYMAGNTSLSPTDTYVAAASPTEDWVTMTGTILSANPASNGVFFDTPGGAVDVYIRNVRFTNTPIPVSAFPVGSGAGYTKVDSITRSGVPMAFSGAAQTNLVPTTLPDWTNVSNCTVINNQFRETIDNSDHLVRHTISADPSTLTIEVEPIGREYIELRTNTSFGSGSAVFHMSGAGTVYSEYAVGAASITLLSNGRYLLGLKGGTSNTAYIRSRLDATTNSYAGDPTKGYNIYNTRSVNLSAPVPPFVDGTGAGESAGVDLLTCTPTWPAQGTIIQAVMPYGYSGAGNPVNVNARLWNSDGANINTYLGTTAGKPTYSAGSITAHEGFTADMISIVAETWNGTTTTIRKDNGALDSASDATVPSGDLIIGNYLGAAPRPFHGGLVTIIFDWVLSDAEYETIRVGLNNLFSSVNFQ